MTTTDLPSSSMLCSFSQFVGSSAIALVGQASTAMRIASIGSPVGIDDDRLGLVVVRERAGRVDDAHAAADAQLAVDDDRSASRRVRHARAPAGSAGREPVEPLGVAPQDLVLRLRRAGARCGCLHDARCSRATWSRSAGSRSRTSRCPRRSRRGSRCRGASSMKQPKMWSRNVARTSKCRVEVDVGGGVVHERHALLHPVALLVEHLLGALEEVRDPADLALGQRDLEVRVALEHAAEQPREHRPRGADRAPRRGWP